jgi:hypothetical protein
MYTYQVACVEALDPQQFAIDNKKQYQVERKVLSLNDRDLFTATGITVTYDLK